MILKTGQFVGPILIEGLHDNSATSAAISENLGYYIKLHEREYLDKILGPISSVFISSIQNSTIDDSIIEKRWESLKEFLSKDCSPLAMYVFFYYVRGMSQVQTPTGVKSEALSPYQMGVSAWNGAIPQNKEVFNLLSNGDYEGFVFDNELIRPIW